MSEKMYSSTDIQCRYCRKPIKRGQLCYYRFSTRPDQCENPTWCKKCEKLNKQPPPDGGGDPREYQRTYCAAEGPGSMPPDGGQAKDKSLRAWFAGQALATDCVEYADSDIAKVAERACRLADAMLAELAKGGEHGR